MLRALVVAGALCAACAAPARAADPPPQTPAPIPFKKDEPEGGAGLAQALAALALAAVAGGAAIYALRRSRLVPGAWRGASRRITLVETMRLDPRVTLYLVVSDGRTFLLGRAGDSLVVLRESDAPASPGAA